ncbi:M50 family metallopeptidase [Phenylobacterium aquaticum]|uniref:M50 family metallopeptidase n=1 Tax=Phenylobacterium aquaticum TaxID=1763816 RepID=UPI001F5CABFA|nr:RIP metalloprotease [Phenylobacterium aquaticum]MCI3134427.1 RIP metalloprotease [Phenylobacterium aquaticum]
MIGFLQGALNSAVCFVLVLTLVVTIHELGHFLAAKACGVAIDRFSIGFGRPILSWTDKSGVEWRVGWIPLGGYVRFSGDDNAASVPDRDDLDSLRAEIESREGRAAVARYYHFKPLWQRAFVAAAGPMANFALAITLFASLLLIFGQYVSPPRVAAVNPNSPAALAGFQPGDFVLKVQGKPIRSFDEIAETAQIRVNLPTQFTVRRGETTVDLVATPALINRPDAQMGGMRKQGTLGLTAQGAYEHLTYGPVQALAGGVDRTADMIGTTVFYLGRMITGQVAADQLSGPLGIARVSGKIAHNATADAPNLGAFLLGGGVALLQLAAAISVGVGFMNLLPVPVLDGGHLLFYAYEALARRPLAAKVQAAGYRVGLALVLGLMLFATWNDLQQLRVFKILGGLPS